MSAQTISFGPLLSVLYGVFKSDYHFRYPCEVVYLLREESMFEYIVLFLYSALNIQLNAAFLFVADAGFFGINLYLVAAFENLADDFRKIERIDSNSVSTKARNQKEKFVNCVNFHRNLLRLTDELQNLYSPIIFFQFLMSCLQICAITLELILHEHITLDRFVQVLPVYPTILAILFIYCYFGNELSAKASEVSMTVYNAEWYHYPLTLQKLTPLIIQRAQCPVIIDGFKLFSCTLENYAKIGVAVSPDGFSRRNSNNDSIFLLNLLGFDTLSLHFLSLLESFFPSFFSFIIENTSGKRKKNVCLG
ncbi:odorant receptor 4-like [Sitodiplosis mosellana]|uniref:odorant receptor 4-like n=1 Tax=Sitodiplosis mosellana TaxID=263140 RepID=UPI002444F3CC|nr:odorant receptor 4-like [Sitodiplosis mosellana]